MTSEMAAINQSAKSVQPERRLGGGNGWRDAKIGAASGENRKSPTSKRLSEIFLHIYINRNTFGVAPSISG